MAGQPPTHPPGDGQLVDLPDLPHAWSTHALWFCDSARVALVLGSLYLIYLLAFSAFRSRTGYQRAIITSFLLAVLLSVWTQIERIGRPVSWRLPVVAVMVALGTWGALRYITGGQRLRHFGIRSFLLPPPPASPPERTAVPRRRRPSSQGPTT